MEDYVRGLAIVVIVIVMLYLGMRWFLESQWSASFHDYEIVCALKDGTVKQYREFYLCTTEDGRLIETE